MKLITPFTILNQNFHEMELINEAMNKKRLLTKKFYEDYRKLYKNHQFAYQYLMEFLNELWHNQPNIVIGAGLATLIIFGIYIKLLDIYQQYFILQTSFNAETICPLSTSLKNN